MLVWRVYARSSQHPSRQYASLAQMLAARIGHDKTLGICRPKLPDLFYTQRISILCYYSEYANTQTENLPCLNMNQSSTTMEVEKITVSSMELQPATSSDKDSARKLVQKCDLHLLPPLFLVWFFPFIDRINIGNARIQGLEKDLHLTGNQFNIALVVFFIPFILLEAPTNIGMKRFSPRLWLSGQTLLLGNFTVRQGVVKTYGGLIGMRVFVGTFEGGLIPGTVFLLSAYYPRFELGWRLGVLVCSTALASAFGGLLAYAKAGMAGTGGYLGWRWILII